MKLVYLIALTLLIVGGLNWGLVGLFGFNLVDAIFGPASLMARTVYLLVGISAVVAGANALMRNSATAMQNQ